MIPILLIKVREEIAETVIIVNEEIYQLHLLPCRETASKEKNTLQPLL
jgi:hypothetical protein